MQALEVGVEPWRAGGAAGGGVRGGGEGAVQEEGAERREEGPGKIWSVVDFSLVVPQQLKHRVTI